MKVQPSVYGSGHVLTLKNLYRLLTQKDFPLFSDRVFPAKATQGQTLVRFWQSYFSQTLPENIDLTIFDQSESRSRSLTTLLNRNGAAGFRREWLSRIKELFSEDFFLSMAREWIRILSQGEYHPSALEKRLKQFLRDIASTRDLETDEISIFLEQQFLGREEHRDTIPIVFSDACFLTWLTLLALLGSRVQDPALTHMRTSHSYSVPVLYQRYCHTPLQCLTNRSCTLCSRALPEDAYFGRKQELDKAVSLLQTRGKLLICGIGGIGKSEFVRQLLQRLEKSGAYQQIALVQYEGSLASSYALAFPSLPSLLPEDILKEVEQRLASSPNQRSLLVLDNVDTFPSADTALQSLPRYSCDIILTSRLPEFTSFADLFLEGLRGDDALSLFQYHYRYPVRDQHYAIDRLCQLVDGHPLALSLFARLCRVRFMTPGQLAEKLEDTGLSGLHYVQEGQSVDLSALFTSTYALTELTVPQHRMMRLFSLLPYRPWHPTALLPLAQDICGEQDALIDLCHSLYELGWLMESSEGYYLHPMIARTLHTTPCAADDFPLLWQYFHDAAALDYTLDSSVILHALSHTDQLSPIAFQTLVQVERSQNDRSFCPIPDVLYARHAQYLKEHPHTPEDTIIYWLSLCNRDILLRSDASHLPDYLNHLLDPAFAQTLQQTDVRRKLLFSLEYAYMSCPDTLSERLFALTRPTDVSSPAMAEYAIAYSVHLRCAKKDLPAAIQSLQTAQDILTAQGMEQTIHQANLDYRLAVCYLDLNRYHDAEPLLSRCLHIMRDLGYPDNAANMMNTASTYAVALLFNHKPEEALNVYKELTHIYQKQHRTNALEYAFMRNNTASAYEQMGQYAEASRIMEEVLELDNTIHASPAYVATHAMNAARFLLLQKKSLPKAHAYLEQAMNIRKNTEHPDSPAILDLVLLDGVWQIQSGKTESGRETVRQALEKLTALCPETRRSIQVGRLFLEESSPKT